MTPVLYNCKHSGDQYLITKFDRHGEVESSYLCDHGQCQCPAGVRDTCRHRQMLPMFLEEGLVNTNLFLNWDKRSITDFNGLPALPPATVQNNETDHIDWDILAEERLGQRAKPATVQSLEIIEPTPAQTYHGHHPIHDLAPQALTDTSPSILEPTNILSPGDVDSSYDLSMDMFTKDVTPADPKPAAPSKPWRRF